PRSWSRKPSRDALRSRRRGRRRPREAEEELAMRRPARLIMASALLLLVAAASSAQVIDPFNASGIAGMAKAGNYAAVENRLNVGDSPNTLGENEAPALTVAILNGHCDIAKLLLQWHARTDIKDRLGNTALM